MRHRRRVLRRALDRAGSTGRRLVLATVRRTREKGRKALTRASRLAGATVAAFVAAELVGIHDPPPLVAALTALLVVQVTLTGTLISGLQRVLAVVVGVVLALGFVAVTGLSWWSLALIVAASIIVGQLLRLGDHLLEVPISAMLVLGVGGGLGAESAAAGRAVETVIGAVVGVLVNVLVPPQVQSRDAGRAVVDLAGDIGRLLDDAAAGIGELDADRASRWLEDARRLNRHVPRLDRALAEAEQSRQLNVRALAERNGGIGLRDGLDALEHCSVTLRGLFRALRDLADRPAELSAANASPVPARAELLRAMARAVRAFGVVLMLESGGSDPAVPEAALATALDELRDRAGRAVERPLTDPRERRAEWELDAALAIAVERIVTELDVGEHARARAELRDRRHTLHPPPWVDRIRPLMPRLPARLGLDTASGDPGSGVWEAGDPAALTAAPGRPGDAVAEVEETRPAHDAGADVHSAGGAGALRSAPEEDAPGSVGPPGRDRAPGEDAPGSVGPPGRDRAPEEDAPGSVGPPGPDRAADDDGAGPVVPPGRGRRASGEVAGQVGWPDPERTSTDDAAGFSRPPGPPEAPAP